ncbi:protein of unknown function [Methylorubrum extorquens DM4]|uniref:Uncharacterized protein n=2 Tax=Methylorubrum extorquens TaxID=408 RepID=C7CJL9_METED|nr:hypothetical protein B2G69_13855 [Methylorubrum zatmanii]CAX23509.1 protein of unknown function [Methylorubrum extorquens DM4]
MVAAVRRLSEEHQFAKLSAWADDLAGIADPRKADQDRLDAVLCALIGLHWHLAPRDASIMIDDREAGYMVAPASLVVRQRLAAAAAACGVSTDADWNPMGNAKTAQLADQGWNC